MAYGNTNLNDRKDMPFLNLENALNHIVRFSAAGILYMNELGILYGRAGL